MTKNSDKKEDQKSPMLDTGTPQNEQFTQQNKLFKKSIFREDHNLLLSALCISFGTATWLPVNAIFTQMPLLTQYAPESWALPSYFSVLVQIANIAPVTYYFVKGKKWCSDSLLICFFLLLSTLSLFLLSLTYHIQVSVSGSPHSVFFFLFSFLLSLGSCISSVLFLPFMGKLPEVYLISFFIGEGLSGFIPSSITMMQGVVKEKICINETINGIVTKKEVMKQPLFSPGTFLFLMSAFMLFNSLCFLYLRYFSGLIARYSSEPKPTDTSEKTESNPSNRREPVNADIPKLLLLSLLVVQGVINCFSNGILPSIMSYSCLPYGPTTYRWAINVKMVIAPLASYLAYFLPVVSFKVLAFCCVFEVLCINYELITAFTSPYPPFMGTTLGILLTVFAWVCGAGLISFIKLSIAAIVKRRHEKALFNYGIATQLGSTIGAVVAFVLINHAKLLRSAPKEKCV